MKKAILVVMICAIVFYPIYSTPQEYSIDEFPQWSLHLRRGETLFFGSLPLTFALSSLSYGLVKAAGVSPVSTTDLGETMFLFSTAAAISLTIAVVDYYLGK